MKEYNKDMVVLVDSADQEIGIAPKLDAHRDNLLHRAISVFAYDSHGKWILQKRAGTKYHSQNLWSNTCCSHPYPGEDLTNAASRRLKEEMSLGGNPKKVFDFLYQVDLENDLSEHELDHVFIVKIDQQPIPNPEEVSDWRKISFEELVLEVKENPDQFSAWFKLIYARVQEHIEKSENSMV